MGFTTTNYSVFASDTRQTPKTLEMVLDFAGWTVAEAAREAAISASALFLAVERDNPLPQDQWQKLLDVAGRRAFDFDGESS